MDKTKYVCLIYEFLSEQGGLEREIINHANFLIDSGYKVKVLTCHLDKKILEQLPFEGIEIEEISKLNTKIESLKLISCFLGLNKIKQYNPDFFISYSAPMNFLIRKTNAKKINYINHFPHYLYLTNKEKLEWASGTQGIKRYISLIPTIFLNSWMKKTDKRLVKKNDLTFMNSEYTKKRLEKIYKINSIVNYPPLDKRFNNPSEKNLNDKFIFSSSRIIPDKKYHLLIQSCSLMKNKLPLYLAGSVEESYKNKLITLAKELNVELKFLGRLNTEEIKDYYTNAQVFAFATPGEDFGLVPAESMACGTPCVIWGDGAGPTEQVIDGLTGYHAKPYEVKDFAEKLDKVIDTKMKLKNKSKIINSSKRFSYSEIKKDFMKHINKII